ncbi:hypothetical protein [Pseudoroseicyclus tamaricis]|uniref:RNA polymerase sigma-70 factor (ECF subfamily) n=1 Tax=Pseudoroseicyclus tamaricis TaxID=2705421 RepID=A0A6B2JSP6_9RHOB|nr:hypothetical protein [Pseudoroseicyclus tamaricis]NDV01587.1 hypothetical protein [Pseudoroseicyclus tamaricis]
MAEDALTEAMRRVADGDREALSRLFAEAAPRLNGLARAMLGEGEAAAEAMEAAFRSAWQEGAGFPASGRTARAFLLMRLHREAAARQEPPGKLPELPEPERYLALNPAAESLDEDALIAIRQAWLFGAGYDRLAKEHAMALMGVRAWLRDNLALMRDDERGEAFDDFAEYQILAAEEALGLLSQEESEAYREAEGVMPELADEEADWAAHFTLFAEDLPPVPPDPALRARLLGRLFGEERGPLWRRLGIVPAIAGGAIAALVLIVAVRTGLVPGMGEPPAPVVAEEPAGLTLAADVTEGRLTAALGETGAEAESYWLWLLPEGQPPQPLGALRPGGEVVLQLPGDLWPVGAELGVSAGPSPEDEMLVTGTPVGEAGAGG